MEIKKVHRVLAFVQVPWFKPYIEFNIERRKKAKSSFEKDFFKLMMNSVFGKAMENKCNQSSVEITTDVKRAVSIMSKPSVESFEILDEDLTIFCKKKLTLFFNKPIYTGLCILDLSKLIMTQFYYDILKIAYEDCL